VEVLVAKLLVDLDGGKKVKRFVLTSG